MTQTTKPGVKENTYARRTTRRKARHNARRHIKHEAYDAIPNTDRTAGCKTSGWLCW